MKKLRRKSGQFLWELDTVKDWREIADLPAVYDYALRLLKEYNIEECDYPADIDEHIRFLIDACEQLEGWLEKWWEDKWTGIINIWYKTPICDLEEGEIRSLYKKRLKYLHLKEPLMSHRYVDKVLWRLEDLLEEIGIAKTEKAAELKDCDAPEWYYYDDEDAVEKRYREEMEAMDEFEIFSKEAEHILDAIPSIEIRAELIDKEEFERKQQEEERWEAFFSKFK